MIKIKYAVIFSLILVLLAITAVFYPTLGVIIMLSSLIAYVLDPIVLWCETWKIPRTLASFALVFGLSFILLGLIAPALPDMAEELIKLARAFPAVYDSKIAPYIGEKIGLQMNWNWILDHLPAGVTKLGTYGEGLGSLAGHFMHLLMFLMILFIFLRDWETIVAATRSLLHDLTPDGWNEEIDTLFIQIGQSLSKLIRGQAEVSSLLAVYYLVAFQAIAVIAAGEYQGIVGFIGDFFTPSVWMVLGVLTGYLNLLPYIGVPVGGLIAALMALISFQFDAIWVYPAIVVVVTLGVTIDHKMLTPRVIGRSVSVHELWVYIAVYIGYAGGGVMGVILALPAMTVVSEVVKRSLALWREHRHSEREREKTIATS